MAQDREKPKDYIEVTPGKGHTRIHISTGKMILNNFLGGLAWGLGTVLGATVIVAIVIILLTKLNTVPVIGDFFSKLLETIQPQSTP
ncbi:MAG: hypothetical protein A2Z11_01150 [Candidatus Woykebacteria bacterium RBG_16_43_9]|uniref:Uncharacterized protein n=1 Tax=Candidatus Woykebacteria bacterium RBG_16_43_9 TaxID=1802596 RepID=A0A1G1WF26_9BACT|nr:MAG: hypothetical protein A2Z11_01150 [Candidatus Woykebacteria bacterium RBG_16_43_9]